MTKKKESEIKTPTVASPKFSIEKLRANCKKLFGVSVSTFDGATYGLNGEYTVADMKSIISKWQNKEVK